MLSWSTCVSEVPPVPRRETGWAAGPAARLPHPPAEGTSCEARTHLSVQRSKGAEKRK